jgi:hypothetical protein
MNVDKKAENLFFMSRGGKSMESSWAAAYVMQSVIIFRRPHEPARERIIRF